MSTKQPYDSSWDTGNDELWDQKYEEWEERDWWDWLSDTLTFPFEVIRKEDLSANPFIDNSNQPFSVDHKMKVIGIEDEDEMVGLIIKAKEGRKTGYVPLCEVEVTSREHPNFWPLREYVVYWANR